MRGIKLDSAKEGIRRFVEGLYSYRDRDMLGYIDTYISFITFNDIVQARLSRMSVTKVIPIFKQALDRIIPRGMSALWDAFGAAVWELSEDNKKDDENWIVLLTNGRDNASRKFNLKKLKEYIKKTGIEPRMMIIGLGNSVEEFKLRYLSKRFRGQYVKSTIDSTSIISSLAQLAKSIRMNEFTSFMEIDAIRNMYGNLGAKELARAGITKAQPSHKLLSDSPETDIFKMTMVSLRLDLPEAVLRLNRARQEGCEHDISGVGRSEGVEISGVLNTETHQIVYCKHRKVSESEIQGACTCDDFRHRAGELGIPCKHLWLVKGTVRSQVSAEDRLKEDIARVLSGINREELGLDADQTAKIIELMQNKLTPLVTKTLEAKTGHSTDSKTTLEYMILDSLSKKPGGMTVDRLCAEMNVKTINGKKKVRIVLKFLELKLKIRQKDDKYLLFK